MNTDTKDHFWANLDKFILLFLFIIVLGIAVVTFKRNDDLAATQWIEGVVSSVLTGLMALLGQKAFQRSGDNKNGNGNGGADVTKKETTISTTSVTPKSTL